jgi:hypothetical protein
VTTGVYRWYLLTLTSEHTERRRVKRPNETEAPASSTPVDCTNIEEISEVMLALAASPPLLVPCTAISDSSPPLPIACAAHCKTNE